MATKVTVIATPKLRSSTARAVNHLKQAKCNGLFLPLSKGLERYLTELAEGIPYEYILNRLRESGLIPEPFGAWEYSAEPFLKGLPQIKQSNTELQTYCYGDQFYDKISAKNAVEISLLTLRGSATGRIDVEKWRRLVQEDVEQGAEALRREADFVASKAGRHENSVCISGLSGRHIAAQLGEEGYDVKVKYLDLPHHLTPLETLKNEARQGEITDERIKSLVSQHIDYVRRYLLHSNNPDEAYRKWVHQEAELLGLPAVM